MCKTVLDMKTSQKTPKKKRPVNTDESQAVDSEATTRRRKRSVAAPKGSPSKPKKERSSGRTAVAAETDSQTEIKKPKRRPSEAIDSQPKKTTHKARTPKAVIVATNEYKGRSFDEINRNKLSEAPLHINYRSRRNMTTEQRDSARQEGLVIKRGPFTAEENAILNRNWRTFCDDYPIDRPHLLLGFFKGSLSDEDRDDVRAAHELVANSEMDMRLARGLPHRHHSQIYQRARKLFNGLRRACDLTAAEKQSIWKMYANRVKKREIAAEFMVDIRVVEELIRKNMSSERMVLKKSLWDDEENQRFAAIIRSLTNSGDYSDIPWEEVSRQMGDRAVWQCRQHFQTRAFYKLYNPDSNLSNKWSRNLSLKLIYFLDMCEEDNDENDVDWDLVKEKFADVCAYNTMTRNWYQLKISVDGWERKTYRQIVNELFKKWFGATVPDIIHEEFREFWGINRSLE